VNQGTLYPVLLKLEQEGAITSEWGASENNRRARFYRLTRTGRTQLQIETRGWNQTAMLPELQEALFVGDLRAYSNARGNMIRCSKSTGTFPSRTRRRLFNYLPRTYALLPQLHSEPAYGAVQPKTK
jgi:hypothetical protein